MNLRLYRKLAILILTLAAAVQLMAQQPAPAKDAQKRPRNKPATEETPAEAAKAVAEGLAATLGNREEAAKVIDNLPAS